MIKVLFFGHHPGLHPGKKPSRKAPEPWEISSELSDRYGGEFRDEAFDGDTISDRVIVLVNGRHIAHTGGAETRLSEGDTVAVFPIIGGG